MTPEPLSCILEGWIHRDGRADPEKCCVALGPAQTNLQAHFGDCVWLLGHPVVTVNGLTWLLTCASLSQAGVRGQGQRGLAEESRRRRRKVCGAVN